MLLSVLRDFAFRRGGPGEPEPTAIGEVRAVPKLAYERGGTIVALMMMSRGDAVKEHVLEMIEPLRQYCKGVAIIDLRESDWRASFDALAGIPIWFAFAPFGVGELFWAEGGTMTSPWADAGIPVVRLYGDTPAYFPLRHIQPFANSINAYGHVEHHEYFVRWFSPKAPSVTLPLFPFDRVAKGSVDVASKMAGTIIFPKNGNCPDKLAANWRKSLPPEIFRALRAVAEEADASLDGYFDSGEAILRYFARMDIDLSENRRLANYLVAQIDDHLRRRKSTMIARSLLDLPVTIRGDNWEHVDFSGHRAKYDPDSDYVRTRELLDKSMAIIDMSPNTQRGPHDRVLRAAGRQTAFLTNRTKFYTEGFPRASTFTFQFTPESVRECIERALSRPRETVELGLDQAVRMGELLTVERYVDQVLTVVDACALACGGRPDGTQDFVSYDAI